MSPTPVTYEYLFFGVPKPGPHPDAGRDRVEADDPLAGMQTLTCACGCTDFRMGDKRGPACWVCGEIQDLAAWFGRTCGGTTNKDCDRNKEERQTA